MYLYITFCNDNEEIVCTNEQNVMLFLCTELFKHLNTLLTMINYNIYNILYKQINVMSILIMIWLEIHIGIGIKDV